MKQWIPLNGGEEGSPSPIHRKTETDRSIIQLEIQPVGLWRSQVQANGLLFEKITAPRSMDIGPRGTPSIPKIDYFTALPMGATIDRVTELTAEEEELELSAPLVPNTGMTPEGSPLIYRPDPKVYSAEALYPARRIETSRTQNFRGRNTCFVSIALVRYRADQNRVFLLKKLTITISLNFSGKKSSDTAKKSRRSSRSLLILTPKDWISCFEGYCKESPLPTRVQALEELWEPDSTRTKTQQLIRYLQQLHRKYDPPRYLILGAENSILPSPVVTCEGKTFASDYSYADIQGNALPEIIVSRFPARTKNEMMKMCEGFLQARAIKNQLKQVLFVSYTKNTEDYNSCIQKMKTFIPGDWKTEWLKESNSTILDVITAIGKGCGIVHYRGHGSVQGWESDNGITTAHLNKIPKKENPPHVFSIACHTADPSGHTPCLGEEWIRSGKAVSFLGATTASSTEFNHQLSLALWEKIHNGSKRTISGILEEVLIRAAAKSESMEGVERNLRMYILYGDPLARIL